MQRTRLNVLFDVTTERLLGFFSNPWRRSSLILISLLLGVFVGPAVSTTTGQKAYLDITLAALILLITEVINIIVYRPTPLRNQRIFGEINIERRSLLLQVLNVFKIGFTYSLFLEAFKLGS